MSVPAAGYDIPPFLSMTDFPIWSEVSPPKGTVYNYPVRPTHDAEFYIVGSSAPAEIAVQIWSRYVIPSMVTRMVQGQKGEAGARRLPARLGRMAYGGRFRSARRRCLPRMRVRRPFLP